MEDEDEIEREDKGEEKEKSKNKRGRGLKRRRKVREGEIGPGVEESGCAMQIIHGHLQKKTSIRQPKAGIRSTRTDFIHTELRDMIGGC